MPFHVTASKGLQQGAHYTKISHSRTVLTSRASVWMKPSFSMKESPNKNRTTVATSERNGSQLCEKKNKVEFKLLTSLFACFSGVAVRCDSYSFLVLSLLFRSCGFCLKPPAAPDQRGVSESRSSVASLRCFTSDYTVQVQLVDSLWLQTSFRWSC